MNQSETTILQNQVLIMQTLQVLLHPYASDYHYKRDILNMQLKRQIDFCCERFHSMPPNSPTLTIEQVRKMYPPVITDSQVTPAKGSSDPAGEDLPVLPHVEKPIECTCGAAIGELHTPKCAVILSISPRKCTLCGKTEPHEQAACSDDHCPL